MSRPSSGPVSPRPARSRAHSISSDKPSTTGHYTLSCPPSNISPEAAFIAPSAACQIVTNDHDSHASTWYDQNGIDPSDETAIVSPGALQLVNSFLDHLLFNFLQASRATTLANLRPAVTDILKPKLAKDTIDNADEELREYLGGGDEEDYVQPQGSVSRGWDLELVWKRTRLRCMVYSSLGDMEEEDEDMYMEQEDLEVGVDEQISDVISPAVAIFLTSVIEYMGELTLTVAGQAAYHRIRSKIERELKDGTRQSGDVAPQIIVEDMDVERVALDRTLGRLWRGWKKRLRGPAPDSNPRPFSRSSMGHSRNDSGAHESLSSPKIGSDISEFRKSQEPPTATIVEDVLPADIPLPLGDRDVDEIEVPGLVHYSDEDDEEDEEEEEGEIRKIRPKSLYIGRSRFENGVFTPTPRSRAPTPVFRRPRPVSMPVPRSLPFLSRPDTEDAQEADDVSIAKVDEETRSVEDVDDEDDEVSSLSDNDEYHEASQVNHSKVVPRPATAVDEEHWDSDEAAVYEKAEILTSSRVSVGSVSSPSASGSGSESGRRHSRRTSSVQSARLVDVPAPKASSGPRPASLDVNDQSQNANRFPVHRKQKSLDSATLMSSPRSPIERNRKHLTSDAISESEEDTTHSARAEAVDETPRSSESSEPAPTTQQPQKRLSGWPLPREPVNKPAAKVHATQEKQDSSEDEEDEERPSTSRTVTRTAAAGAAIAAGAAGAAVATVASTASTPAKPPVQAGREQPAAAAKAPALPSKSPERSSPDQKNQKKSTKHYTESKGTPLTLETMRTKEYEDGLSTPAQAKSSPRPIHAPASSTSSASNRLKPVRTSEDNSSTSRSESVARNFEELIHSNQTITYTLTPESMRDNSKRSFDSPVVTKLSKPNPGDISPSPSSYRSPSFGAIAENEQPKLSGPVPRAPTGLAISSGRGAGQARDARAPGESMADFAEFIKATGPPAEPKRASNVRNGPPPVSLPMSPPMSPPTTKAADPRPQSAASNMRSRQQPREAAAEGRSDRDLLDFIRQGPPIAASNHRIPRQIAPFRTTMDSDQLNGVMGGKAVDATIPDIRYSQGSTNATEHSIESSLHSSSALLKNNKGAAKLGATFDEDDIMPKRKTRRVPDPYALDFSDEDDDLFDDVAAPPRPAVKKEESLAEFLRNYDPPPAPVEPARKAPKKKASAPSLMTRFSRSNMREAAAPSPVSPPPPRPSAAENRSLHSSAGTINGKGGHIPIQINMPAGYGKYGPLDDIAPARRTPSNVPRAPKPKFEPREAVSRDNSQTAELANFLRNSRPPPERVQPPPVMPPAPVRQEESSGFSRMFGRKKKSAAY